MRQARQRWTAGGAPSATTHLSARSNLTAVVTQETGHERCCPITRVHLEGSAYNTVRDNSTRLGLEALYGTDPIYLGVGVEITIRQLEDLIREVARFEEDVPWGVTQLDRRLVPTLDTARARELLALESHAALRDKLTATTAWYDTKE